jgi:glycosyltransferase involved in cell wall biosynthesis
VALRVVHLCLSQSHSGLEQYVLETVAHQFRNGVAVSFFGTEGSPLSERVRRLGVTVTVVPTRSQSWHLRAALGPGWDEADFVLHVHSTQDLKALVWLFATHRWRPRIVVQTHIWISHPKRDPFHWWLNRNVDLLLGSSPQAVEQLRRMIPIPSERVRRFRYGREVSSIESSLVTKTEARVHLGLKDLPDSTLIFGAIARVDAGKGVREFVAAAERALGVSPNLALVWIGSATPNDPKAVALELDIRSRLNQLPEDARRRLRFLGQVPDATRWLRAFDVFVLPTYRECFSLALLEAQLAGLPAIACRSGGSPELVKEGQTGWLIEPESTSSLCQSIEQALQEVNAWPEMGRRAADRVRREFDSNSTMKDILSCYDELQLGRVQK